ncbi:unnamed protein product [marine sediment metagenome]|uniref:Uncharacterized protein n=1 Tax=marine sediment metagenome TaxID=412755 RepID=X1G3R6_9ZZZZ
MKSRQGINYLAEVTKIKEKGEDLVRELNTFLTPSKGLPFQRHIWLKIERIIGELAEAIK